MAELQQPSSIAQEFDLPGIVELFIVKQDGNTIRVTNSHRASNIYWDGSLFHPLYLNISGIGFTEDNLSEKPKLVLTNVGHSYDLLFSAIPDLKGATLDYIITYDTYINTTSSDNTNLYQSKHYYVFSKLLSKTEVEIVYELDTLLTYNNKKLPNRQMLRDGKLNLRFEGLGLAKQA